MEYSLTVNPEANSRRGPFPSVQIKSNSADHQPTNTDQSWTTGWNNSPFWLTESPSAHFSTPATACPQVLASWVAHQLAEHGLHHLVEVGAGDSPVGLGGVRRSAVDLREVPRIATTRARWDALAARWSAPVERIWADGRPVLLLAVEWLDDLACPVVAGGEELGPAGPVGPVAPADRAWLDRWWPGGSPAEVGRTRDAAWRWFAERLPAGSVLATIDYGHTVARRPAGATLAAHRGGRTVAPGTPGSNLTAHVAVDSLAATVEDAGATRLAMAQLADLPVPEDAPPGLAGLALRSELALWRDPARFGAYWWLAHRIGGHNGARAE